MPGSCEHNAPTPLKQQRGNTAQITHQQTRPRLPEELFLAILEMVPVCDMVKCRELSKLSCKLVDNTPSLQYRVELLLAGMEDLGYTGHTIFEKRKLLKQYVTTRNTLAPKDIVRHTIDIEDDLFWDFVGGFFCQAKEQYIKVTQLSSPIREIVRREWKIPMDPPVIFGVHSPQDLLLAVHREQKKIRLTPLSLSSGAQHPDSIVRQCYIDVPRFFDFEDDALEIAVTDDVAVVCFMRVSGPEEVSCSIVDWKTGEMRYERFDEKGVTSFCLLDGDHLLFSSVCQTAHAPKLSVINICTSARVDFLFPKLAMGFGDVTPHLSSGPEALSRSSLKLAHLPFQIPTKERLIILGFVGDDHDHQFIIPSWALYQELSRVQSATNPTSVTIPWVEWGPQQTAHFCDEVYRSLFGTPAFTSYGTRCILARRGYLVIRDFNRFFVRHGAGQGENKFPKFYEDDRDDLPWAIESSSVETFLPWREIRTKFRVGHDHDLGFDNDFMITLFFKSDGETAEIISF